MEKTLFLKEALQIMKRLDNEKNPIAFNLKVRQYNRQTKNGGKIKIYENVTLLQQAKNKNASGDCKQAISPPRHWENRTRNIKLQNGDIQKIHILFIIELNGQKVVY